MLFNRVLDSVKWCLIREFARTSYCARTVREVFFEFVTDYLAITIAPCRLRLIILHTAMYVRIENIDYKINVYLTGIQYTYIHYNSIKTHFEPCFNS